MSNDSGQVVRARSRRPSVKFLLVLWLILALVGECLWQFVGPPHTYTTEAKFERRTDPASADSPRIQRDVEALRLTLEYELAGLPAMTQAAEDEGLTKGLPHDEKTGQLTAEGVIARQELVKGLMAATKVRWDARSEQVDLASVVFTHHDPRLAERIPDRLVRNYINRMGEKTKQTLLDSHRFLQEQIAECTSRLDAQIKARQEFEAQYLDVKPQDPGYLPQQIQQAYRDVDRMRSQKTAMETKLALLGMLMPNATTAPATPADASDAILYRLQEDGDHRPGGTVPASPDVLRIQVAMGRMEIELAEREIARLRTRLAELNGLQGRLTVARAAYLRLLEKELQIEAERSNWQKHESAVQMSLAAELANRRIHLSAVQAAQKASQPDEVLSPWAVAGWALGCGFVLSALLTLLVWAVRVASFTTVACLVLLALILSLAIFGPGIREGVGLAALVAPQIASH